MQQDAQPPLQEQRASGLGPRRAHRPHRRDHRTLQRRQRGAGTAYARGRRQLNAQRLFRLLLPRAYGGEEVDLVTWFRAMETLATLDASTAWCVGQINGCAATAAALAPDVAREIWGAPDAALSWGPAANSRADAVEGGHRLAANGCSRAAAGTPPGSACKPRSTTARARPCRRRGGLRTFFVPARSVQLIENWNVIGLRATNSGGFKVSGLFVPQGYSVSRELSEVQHRQRRSTSSHSTASLPSASRRVALGIARAMLDAIIGARQRQAAAACQGLAAREPPHPLPDRRGRGPAALGARFCRGDGGARVAGGRGLRRADDRPAH